MGSGGWCASQDECQSRTSTKRGSTATDFDGDTLSDVGGNFGYISDDVSNNPYMHDWNHVYLRYCDQGSFSGRGKTDGNMTFAGGLIREAMAHELMLRGLGNATDFVIGGGSAGALAVYIHGDWWAAQVPQARSYLVPFSGFFLDHADTSGAHSHREYMTDMMKYMEVKLNPACISQFEDGWQCLFPEYAAPFLKKPVFALQSRYDSWQIQNILKTSADDVDAIQRFGNDMDAALLNSRLRFFSDSCFHHVGMFSTLTDKAGKATQPLALRAFMVTPGALIRFDQERAPYVCKACCERGY